MNYLALAGLLYKFRRLAKANALTPPANFVADFASGSLHLFNLILQGLYLNQANTVLDCSLTHSTLYLSQLELLKEVQFGSINRNRTKQGVPTTPYTRPHELVFQDNTRDKGRFVLVPGNKLHDEIAIQRYNDEEGDDAKTMAEILQITFNGMTIEQIEKEYSSKVERLVPYTQHHSKAEDNVFSDITHPAKFEGDSLQMLR